MTLPGSACSASLRAAANVPPEEIPQKMPSLLRERARGLDGLVVADGQTLIEDLAIEDRRDEVRRPALDLVRLPLGAAEHRGLLRLDDDDVQIGARRLEHLTGAGERATGTPAGDPVVEALAREVLEDLGAGGRRW